jgi:hypothetical protein
MLVLATFAAAAALVFGLLATRATTGQASLVAPGEGHAGVRGVLSYRAHVVSPPRAHRQAVEAAFAGRHPGAQTVPAKGLREAIHLGVLWALARFALPGGTVVSERFSWRARDGWLDLGATPAHCPSVPPEVRSVWRLTACQTA